jgi:hypothetical protein
VTQPKLPFYRFAGFAIVLLALTGCGSSGEEQHSENLLEYTGFDTHEGTDTLLRPWSFSQHAGEQSYRYTVEGGVLRIQRIGDEPWGMVSQRITQEKLEGLEGTTMEFSVDISADLTEDFGEPMFPTGPSVQIWAHSGEENLHLRAMAGTRLVLSERSELGPGTHDWQRHTVRFRVPEHLARLEVNVAMTLGGEIRVRDPHLAVVDGTQ